MAASDSSRTNQNAVVAVRAMLGSGITDDQAADVVEAVRPHLERPFQVALQDANARITALSAQIAELTAK
jgi:hypothetical protein